MVSLDVFKTCGLHEPILLAEPVASFLSNCDKIMESASSRSSAERESILNIDIGGGTTDFALLEYSRAEKVVKIVKSFGHPVSGGLDLDDNFLLKLKTNMKKVQFLSIWVDLFFKFISTETLRKSIPFQTLFDWKQALSKNQEVLAFFSSITFRSNLITKLRWKEFPRRGIFSSSLTIGRNWCRGLSSQLWQLWTNSFPIIWSIEFSFQVSWSTFFVLTNM